MGKFPITEMHAPVGKHSSGNGLGQINGELGGWRHSEQRLSAISPSGTNSGRSQAEGTTAQI